MHRGAPVLLLVMSVLAAAPAAPAASAAPPPATVPPALAALEQKALALQISSERFSFSESIAGSLTPSGPLGDVGLVLAHSAATAPVISGTGEESSDPQRASLQVSVLGITIQARVIGETLYVEEPFIALLDGGRPWVREHATSLGSVTGGGLGGLGVAPGQDTAQAFGRAFAELAASSSIQELGLVTVDDQATTGFGGSLPLGAIPGLPAKGRRQLRKEGVRTVHLELFLAEDGLPVRTRVSIALHGAGDQAAELIVQADVLGTGIAVSVQPPPAAQTISEKQLKRLESAASHVKVVRRGHGGG